MVRYAGLWFLLVGFGNGMLVVAAWMPVRWWVPRAAASVELFAGAAFLLAVVLSRGKR